MTSYSREVCHCCRAPRAARPAWLFWQAGQGVSLCGSPRPPPWCGTCSSKLTSRVRGYGQVSLIRLSSKLQERAQTKSQYGLSFTSFILAATDVCCLGLIPRTVSHEISVLAACKDTSKRRCRLINARRARSPQGAGRAPSTRTTPTHAVRSPPCDRAAARRRSTNHRSLWQPHHTTADGTARKPAWASRASRTPPRRPPKKNKRPSLD